LVSRILSDLARVAYRPLTRPPAVSSTNKESSMTTDLIDADWTTALSVCYLLNNLAFSVMYVPRLRRILRDEAVGLHANSLLSEVFWLMCRFVAIAYVGSAAQQLLIAGTILLEIIGRTAVVALLWRARIRVCSVSCRSSHDFLRAR
jgi:hypothetical protein